MKDLKTQGASDSLTPEEALTEDFPRNLGEIKAALARRGRTAGPYDMLIAAHARHTGATLVTNNEQEFRRVPGLSVENWSKS